MNDISTLTIDSPAYPPLLKEIPDAPERIFVRGRVEALSHPCCLAVVGTRRCSAYGSLMTTRLSDSLARSGVCVVSGLALGVDTAAHEAALAAHGVTIAVLGSGVADTDIYPARNIGLAQRIIAAQGALVSEYESGTPTYPSHFIERNRIIAGLTRGTLVTEAPLKSGALATARRALDYNRDVYAVPGEATSYRSDGTNNLIKQGALCVTRGEDILDTIEGAYLTPPKKHGTEQALSSTEALIVQAITARGSGAHMDSILQETKLDGGIVSSAIISLTLRGIIQEREPNIYIVVNE